MTISITITKKLLVTALAVILLLGGTAWALAQDNGAGDYLYACVKKNGQVTMAADPADCRDNEVPIGLSTENKIVAMEAQIADLQDQVDQLRADLAQEITDRQAADAALQATADAALTTADELADRFQHFTRDGDNIYITGANLHVVNGTGTTDGDPNSLGNIIIGYNELRGGGTDDRTGSHMLVVGSYNNYSRYGGIVIGRYNTTSGDYASVSGGNVNTASGDYASVSGGAFNAASDQFASVSGGYYGEASGQAASVSGGWYNDAIGIWASVSGGGNNTAAEQWASVSGGSANVADSVAAWVGGGYQNKASEQWASVSGGALNTASGMQASVSGGVGNEAAGYRASVSGGGNNTASGDRASVGGGCSQSVDWPCGFLP